MKTNLRDFMTCVQNVPQLRNAFISCKSLKETYDEFKVMLGDCSYEEYEDFLKSLIKEKNILSEEDLLDVSGGISNFGKKVLTPLVFFTTVANTSVAPFMSGSSGSKVFAAGNQGSEGTTEAELKLSLDYLNTLPTDEEGIAQYLDPLECLKKNDEIEEKTIIEDAGNNNRGDEKKVSSETLEKNDGNRENISIENNEVYKRLKEIVEEIKKQAKKSKYKEKKSEKLIITNSIYRWVAKNIYYDYDSAGKENRDRRKPQDPLYVFENKIGVCEGKAKLAELMLRIAGIPSKYVGTIGDQKDHDTGHAFNAVYIKDDASNQAGWTLFDSTWAYNPLTKTKEKLINEYKKKEGRLCRGFLMKNNVNNDYIKAVSYLLDNQCTKLERLTSSNKAEERLTFSNKAEERFSLLKKFLVKDKFLEKPEDIYNVLCDINDDIKKGLNEINNKYNGNDIEKYEKIEIIPKEDLDASKLTDTSQKLSDRFYIKTERSQETAERVFNKRIEFYNHNGDTEEKFKSYFPAFYEAGKSLEEINKGILSKKSHKISCDFYLDNCHYKLAGFETNAFIAFDARYKEGRNATINKDLLKYGIPFKVFSGIHALTLTGDEEVDFSEADNLHLLDAEESTRYEWGEEGKLYDKITKDKVNIPDKCFQAKNIKGLDFDKFVKLIENMDKGYNFNTDVPIEDYCKGYKIKIPSWEEVAILRGDTEYDFSEADYLKLIDAGESTRYKWGKDGKLHDELTGEEFTIPNQCFQAKNLKELDSIKMAKLIENMENGYSFNTDVPIKNYCEGYKFKIPNWKEVAVLQGDTEYNFSEAGSLKLIDAGKSDRYVWGRDGKLYEKGKKEPVKEIPESCTKAENLNQLSKEDFDKFLFNFEICYNRYEDVPIENYYREPKFKIPSDRKVIVLGDMEYDFSEAKNLKLIDVGNSKYEWRKDGKLYEKDKDEPVEGIPEDCTKAENLKSINEGTFRHLITNLGRGFDLLKDAPIKNYCKDYKFKVPMNKQLLVLSENIEYDFSEAKNLRLIDAGKSRYEWREDGKFYKKGEKEPVKGISESCIKAEGLMDLIRTRKSSKLIENIDKGYNFNTDVPIENYCKDYKFKVPSDK